MNRFMFQHIKKKDIMAGKILYGVILWGCFYTAAVGEYLCDNGIYCLNGCCGGYENGQYCCSSYTSNYVKVPEFTTSIVVGIFVFLLIVLTIIVGVCCCLRRRAKEQIDHVYQTTYPAMAVYEGPVLNPGYYQVTYVSGADSVQIQTANVQPGVAHTLHPPKRIKERSTRREHRK